MTNSGPSGAGSAAAVVVVGGDARFSDSAARLTAWLDRLTTSPGERSGVLLIALLTRVAAAEAWVGAALGSTERLRRERLTEAGGADFADELVVVGPGVSWCGAVPGTEER